jgi:acetylornithine deacetylase/succinyl-diaminopimelate desuccinylase-like protein
LDERHLPGLALPDDSAHSPNEKFDLGVFAKGQQMSARLWHELAHHPCLKRSLLAAA